MQGEGMNVRAIAYCSIFITALAGCALKPEPVSFEKAALEQQANRAVTCTASDDCDAKWNRAIQWVSTNSAQAIKTLSGSMIQTYSVNLGGGGRDAYPAFTIVKYANGKNGYIIHYDSACDAYMKCEAPSGLELKASFVYFVMGKQEPTEAQKQRVQKMRLIAGNISTITEECRNLRLGGQLTTYRESAECSNERILNMLKREQYPYMDMAQALAAKRLELAGMVDDRQMTEAGMQAKMAEYVRNMDETERLRNLEADTGQQEE